MAWQQPVYSASWGGGWEYRHPDDDDDEDNVNRLHREAEDGDAEAMYKLGDCYYFGKGGADVDRKEAVVWFKKGARLENVDCMRDLGFCYYNGDGIGQDRRQAFYWTRRAAETGDGNALGMMGMMYEKGHGTLLDIHRALGYYRQANAKGENRWADFERLTNKIAAERDTRAQADRSKLEQDTAKLQREQQKLAAERLRLEQLQEQVQRDRNALDTAKRDQQLRVEAESLRLAKELAARRAAATAKQERILEKRRQGDAYQGASDQIANALAKTSIDHLTCPCCLTRIQPGMSVLLGNCFHAVCRSCAPNLLGRSGGPDSILCALCGVQSTLIHAFPHHPLIEAELSAATPSDCALCLKMPDEDDRFPATFSCTECATNLCEGHALTHGKKRADHAVIPLPHGGAARRCPMHDEAFVGYCTAAGCRTLVCLKCVLSSHQGDTHETKLLNSPDLIDPARARLLKHVAAARTAADALVDLAADAAMAVMELDERDAALESDTDHALNVLRELIQRRLAALHDEGRHRSAKERATLQERRDQYEHHWRILTSAADLAEQLASGSSLGVGAASLLVDLEEAMDAQLKATMEHVPFAGVPPPAILRLEIDEALHNQLNDLGRIVQDA